MIHDLYHEDRTTMQITDEKISETIKELRNKPEKGKIIVFQSGRETIGYAIVIFYWSNEFGGNILHIDELYVKPQFRKRGVGTSFFKQILQTLDCKTAVALQLEVTPSNSRARRYYQSLGFEKTPNLHLIRLI